ncbi:hypothetical protein D8674_022288 [Pyrus ussuriensis x Pyrus communis]|uniref:PB1-like domain-containing protein n=1 Tax=Pyrus ussuriensis x Pyrus communis TaxID=2448454 RepID=A0A5N5GR61_9ROSA|nr:hypothetical protein D8674_022288 [Pyrus ussuriensis x Pyrus communis]
MRDDLFDSFPTYGNNELFTIQMYHSEQLSEDFYVRGNMDFFDLRDKDFMSMLKVDNMVKELGYGNVFISYQYRIPMMEIHNGLKPLMTNSDVINICKFVPNHTVIDMYIEKITPEECVSQEMKFIKSFEPVAQSSVVIEELDEEKQVQVNRGNAKLAIEYPVSGLGGECSVPSQFVGEKVADEGMADEGVTDVGDEEDDENDNDAVLAGIREQNNPQSGEGSQQQRERFEEEIDVNVVSVPNYNSDGLHIVHKDEDGGGSKSEHYPKFNEKIDMKNPHLSLGLIFRDVTQLRKEVVMHSIINGYGDVYFPRNEKFKVDATCKESEWNHGCFKMKTYKAMVAAMKIIEGNTVKIKLDEGMFQRMYVCLCACKEGLKHGCRPLIGLDGCHLKSQHGGQLLVVVGINPNDETWVTTYAIWFLEFLAEDIGIVDQHGWTFISDKHKGLIHAFLAVLPNCHHRFFVGHLYTNYREQFKGKALNDALWAVAKTTTIPHFRRAMEELRLLNENAYDWFMKRPTIHWSRSHFQTQTKCEMLLNILCKSLNKEKPKDYMDVCYSKVISEDIPQPQQLSRKGQGTLKCGICKKEGQNTRTHHMHLPTGQEASSYAHGASSNPGGVPRKRGRKPKVQTDGGVKKRKIRQLRK